MTDSEIRQLAKEELARNCQACTPPELDDGDLEALLTSGQAAQVWQADTVYPPGAVVVADALSAMSYRAIAGGTSGPTPPSWPGYSYGWSGVPTALYCCAMGTVITDGGVTWTQAGIVTSLYDIERASADGWLLKAAKAVTLIQSSSAGQSTALQLVFDHCQKMAAEWQPYKVA